MGILKVLGFTLLRDGKQQAKTCTNDRDNSCDSEAQDIGTIRSCDEDAHDLRASEHPETIEGLEGTHGRATTTGSDTADSIRHEERGDDATTET